MERLSTTISYLNRLIFHLYLKLNSVKLAGVDMQMEFVLPYSNSMAQHHFDGRMSKYLNLSTPHENFKYECEVFIFVIITQSHSLFRIPC